jgi:uncharacterized protein YbjT (DUF2867 family)
MMHVLLTGASGFIGSQLLPQLHREGHEVRALARDPARLRLPTTWGVEVVQGDVVSGAGLARALAGVEVAYYLIHSMESQSTASTNAKPDLGASAPGPRAARYPSTEDVPAHHPSAEDFAARERTAATRFANAARRAGVRRIVYLGGPLPSAPATAVSRHLASRLAVERTLLQAVPDSVALRASIVIGARSRSFRFMVRLVERMPVLALPAWRRFRTQPIDARDVTEMLAAAAHEPAVGGRSLDIGGPDVLSYGEMIERIAELMLVNRPAVGLSVSVTPVAARVAAAIAGEDPALMLPLMESLEGDLLPADARGTAELLGVRVHSFDSAVEHALAEWEASEPLAAR